MYRKNIVQKLEDEMATPETELKLKVSFFEVMGRGVVATKENRSSRMLTNVISSFFPKHMFAMSLLALSGLPFKSSLIIKNIFPSENEFL